MSGKSSLLSNAVLNLIFLGEALATLFENNTVSPATEIWQSLHTADPGPGGNQGTFEVAYAGYARVSVSRDSAGFVAATADSISPVNPIIWPTSTGGAGIVATFWGIGLADSGPGTLLYSGPITPPIACTTGVEPELTVASTITES